MQIQYFFCKDLNGSGRHQNFFSSKTKTKQKKGGKHKFSG